MLEIIYISASFLSLYQNNLFWFLDISKLTNANIRMLEGFVPLKF